MASEAKMYPAMNPEFISPDSLNFEKCEFYSKVFRISETEAFDETASYIELMNGMFPYDPQSDFQLNPMGNAISKTWTKEGDLLIHVEYIKMIRETEPPTADNHEF